MLSSAKGRAAELELEEEPEDVDVEVEPLLLPLEVPVPVVAAELPEPVAEPVPLTLTVEEPSTIEADEPMQELSATIFVRDVQIFRYERRAHTAVLNGDGGRVGGETGLVADTEANGSS